MANNWQPRFKIGDVVKFNDDWASNPNQFFTVTGYNEHSLQYTLAEIPHGFFDLGSDDQLEPGSAFVAQAQRIYAEEDLPTT